MNDKFILMGKEKELLIYLEQYVFHSLPKNEKVLRDNITIEMYEMIKILLELVLIKVILDLSILMI